MRDLGSQTLFLSHGKEFVAFDGELTLRPKVEFLLNNGLGYVRAPSEDSILL
jgi:hypothetical protein